MLDQSFEGTCAVDGIIPPRSQIRDRLRGELELDAAAAETYNQVRSQNTANDPAVEAAIRSLTPAN